MRQSVDTIAALGTPAGTAALALLRVSGPDTGRIATELAGSPPRPRQARHADYRDRGGRLVDDVVLIFFAGPHSYTGEDTLEISCHGNPFIAQKILEDLLARGCRAAEPGEFTQRAFLHGRLDLSQAEAVMDVIHARSERALAFAQQQLRGALARRMEGLIDGLLGVLARIEAYIDFPEEDLPPEDQSQVGREIDRLAGETSRLLATSHYGAMLRGGIRTVILGPPNAGKSSLLNRLVGYERALVSPEPGTTRDFLEEEIMVGPHALRIIDTAGLNPTPGEIERRGIEKTVERSATADLFLVVQDATEPPWSLPDSVRAQVLQGPAVWILNKSDLAPEAPPPSDWPFPFVRLSALTGAGMDDLVVRIAEAADSFQQAVGEETIAVSARHARALDQAREGLSRARGKLDQRGPIELIASDLRDALAAFGEVTGKVDNERMLDQLFASFCIGK
jgi:tRNA modification GTPase